MKDRKNVFAGINWRTYAMVLVLLVISIIFQALTKGVFFTPRNLSNLVRQMSITGVIVTGFTLVLISGGIDLSVGSVVAVTGGIAAILQVNFGWSTPAVIGVSLIAGTVLGSWSGFWVAYKKIPPFIATMGGMLAFRGTYLVMTNGITITPLQDDFKAISSGFLSMGTGYILAVLGVGGIAWGIFRKRKSQGKYGFEREHIALSAMKCALLSAIVVGLVLVMNHYQGVPYPVLIFVVCLLALSFVSKKTAFGRSVYAVGGNVEAARLSGINVNWTTMRLYMITGFLSAVCGILLVSRLNGATSAAGTNYEMDCVSSCVIGGCSLSGGKGSVMGALIGALIISTLDNGMSLMNLSIAWQNVVKGLVLIMAVWFDVASTRHNA